MDRALLVGINTYPSSPLVGCVNDIRAMGAFLAEKCHFNFGDIRLLTDARATTSAIVEHLQWLVDGARKGDRLLFHYSGHGAQILVRSPAGQIDGINEVICPVDFDWSYEHALKVKDFNRIFGTVRDGIEFIWISDTCHSGSLLKGLPLNDVRYKTLLPPVDVSWELLAAIRNGTVLHSLSKSANEMNVAIISACSPYQICAEAVFANEPFGALTYLLLSQLYDTFGQTAELVDVVRRTAESLEKNGFKQEPQLEGRYAVRKRAFLKAI